MTTGTTPTQVKLTREFLLEIGGWRAMQEGQSLFGSGKVFSYKFEAPLLTGVVQAGTSTVNARLKLGSRLSDVENLCSCRQAREYGTVCPHVIAVGLAAIQAEKPLSATQAIELKLRKHSTSGSAAGTLKYAPITEAPQGSKLLEVHVLLPLDFKKAWGQEEMRIILEASIDGQPSVPLDSVPRNGTIYAVYEMDHRFLSLIQEWNEGAIPGMWMLNHEERTDFFEALFNHPHVMLGKKQHIKVRQSEKPSELKIDVQPEGDMVLHLEESKGEDHLLVPGGVWHFHGDYLELKSKLPKSYKILRQQDVILPRTAVGHFFQTELPLLERHIHVMLSERCKELKFKRKTPKARITLDGFLAGINAKVEALYGTSVRPLSGFDSKHEKAHQDWVPDAQHPLVYFHRNREAETMIQREVLAAGFQPGQRQAELYTLASENKVGAFLANVLPQWMVKWDVVFTERMQSFYSKCDVVKPEITIQSSGEDWLSLEVKFQESKKAVELSPAEVQRLLQTGVSHHRLENGRIVLLPTDTVHEFNEVLFDCHVKQENGKWHLNKRYSQYLSGVLQSGGWTVSEKSDWKPTADFKEFEDLVLQVETENILRGYQKRGVNWLHHLFSNNLGGVLADEMGLGKTLQTLVYFDYRKRHQLSKGPSLIVGPTSLVKNWMNEAARFTPDLKVLCLHGASRKAQFGNIKDYDLVITSYSLLRRDISELGSIEFDTVVLDEAQNIKNRASQNAQSAKALKSFNRLVLTGTPVENSLLDLWSIFDFLMHGYLGPATEFRDRYEIPISKHSDSKALQRLLQRIRPFVLRRTKSEVAKDLPAKLEQVAYCELTEEQKSVYQSILEQSRRDVFELSSVKQQTGRDRIAILTALTRLRQACCHLKLLPVGEGKEWIDPSGKMNYFFELLDEAIDGGHRVLVFSQFVSLLRLVEHAIKEHNIKYCYLDGATLERQAEVDRFQSNPDIPVFLISLKAGGTGLNLTGADTVIHFDPWWNPAVEDQATARAHRMGQLRIVTSYKLIARGTVEEKIVQLQQRKKDLITSTIVSEEAFINSLTWEELQGLLE